MRAYNKKRKPKHSFNPYYTKVDKPHGFKGNIKFTFFCRHNEIKVKIYFKPKD
jgi:hypothetical protein